MINPRKVIQLDAILEIKKMVFIQPWTRKQFKNYLSLLSNAENWVYLEVSVKNKPVQTLYKSMGFLQEGMHRDYYAKGDQAFLYQFDLVDNG